MIEAYNILHDIVSIPSPSGKEKWLAGYIEAYLNGGRLNVLRYENNIATWIKGKDRSRAFILNGHLDTVPPTKEWTTNPFKLQSYPFDDDKLTGLGVSDMKSGLAVMLDLVREACYNPPDCDLWFMFSADEETDGSGSLLLLENLADDLKKRYETVGGLILEPTDGDSIGVGHRGDTLWHIRARGPGGHASEIYSEKTAIEKLGHFVVDLPRIREQWGLLYKDDMLDVPTINPTVIGAGAAANVVPEIAEGVFNSRITPQFKDELDAVRKGFAEEYDFEIVQSWEPSPTKCDENAAIYRAAQQTALPIKAFIGATDQFAFHEHGIPMMIYGPGNKTAMHQPNEWVRLSAMEKCKAKISDMIEYYVALR